MANTLRPRLQFFERVKIVVALLCAFAFFALLKPLLVVAPVQADVAHRGGGALAGPERGADDRLVNVAEADAALVGQPENK